MRSVLDVGEGGLGIPAALAQVAAAGPSQWLLRVAPGWYSETLEVPEGRSVTLEGAARNTLVGDLLWRVGSPPSFLVVRNLGLGVVLVSGELAAGPATSALALENSHCDGIAQLGLRGEVDVAVSGLAPACRSFFGGLGTSSAVYGNVRIRGTLIAAQTCFLGTQLLEARHLHLDRCVIQQNAKFAGDCLFRECRWSDGGKVPDRG